MAGVVSGAGSYRPGLLLDSRGGEGRRPVAMFGKVFCKVAADAAPIDTGDLLTTSSTPGHAMKATHRVRRQPTKAALGNFLRERAVRLGS